MASSRGEGKRSVGGRGRRGSARGGRSELRRVPALGTFGRSSRRFRLLGGPSPAPPPTPRFPNRVPDDPHPLAPRSASRGASRSRARRIAGRAVRPSLARGGARLPAGRALHRPRRRAALRPRVGGRLARGGVPSLRPDRRAAGALPPGAGEAGESSAVGRHPRGQRRADPRQPLRDPRARDRRLHAGSRLLQLRRARQRELFERGGDVDGVGPGPRRGGGGGGARLARGGHGAGGEPGRARPLRPVVPLRGRRDAQSRPADPRAQ